MSSWSTNRRTTRKDETDGLLGVEDALIVTFCFDNFALCVPAMKKNDKNQRPFGRSAPRVYARILFFSTPHVLFFEPQTGGILKPSKKTEEKEKSWQKSQPAAELVFNSDMASAAPFSLFFRLFYPWVHLWFSGAMIWYSQLWRLRVNLYSSVSHPKVGFKTNVHLLVVNST